MVRLHSRKLQLISNIFEGEVYVRGTVSIVMIRKKRCGCINGMIQPGLKISYVSFECFRFCAFRFQSYFLKLPLEYY